MTEELDCFPTLEKAEEYCALKNASVIALNCILRIKTALRY